MLKMNLVDLKRFKNNFFFISDEKLFTILNFDPKTYRFLAYEDLASSLDSSISDHKRPVPTWAYTSTLYNHIVRVYSRTIFGQNFAQTSSAYSFVFGFYLRIIWLLGGGRRFLPLISIYNKANYYGFYDLHFTPLAFLLSTYPLIQWFRGTQDKYNLSSAYFKYNNLFSIFGGPLLETEKDFYFSSAQQSNQGSNFFHPNFLRFFFVLLLTRIFFSLPIFVFHIVVRPLFFWFNFFIYSCVRGSRFSKRSTSPLPYDYFWKRVYFSYFSSVRRLVVIKELGISAQEFDLRESELVGFTYSDVFLANSRVFSNLLYKQGIAYLSGYRPDSFSSFFSGYYPTKVLAHQTFQLSSFKHFSNLHIANYKKSVLKHSFSIKPANISSILPIYDSSTVFPFNGKSSASNEDFFGFVRRFNFYLRATLDSAKARRISPFNTFFYERLTRRSRFIQIFHFRFSNIFFLVVKNLVYFLVKVFLLPFNLLLFWLPGASSFVHVFKSTSSSGKLLGDLFRVFSVFVTNFVSFPIRVFGLTRLYIYLFFEYGYAVALAFGDLLRKFSYFNAYYSYYYFFRRYFHSFFFIRFYTREVEDELDQIKDVADLSEDFLDDDLSGPNDFEFYDYEIGFERPNDYDDWDTFDLDSYQDKSHVNSSSNENFFEEDKRISNTYLFEQLFWGWLTISYSELVNFLFRQPLDPNRFKSIDPSPNSLFDSEFEEHQFISNYGLDDEQYSTEDEPLEEDDYEEFYYDPEFMESFERYYDYVLSDKTLVELSNKLLAYRLKLDKWHSKISERLVPIPREFMLMPSSLRQPSNSDDWKILTLVVSTLVLNDSQDRVFMARNDVEFINNVWSRFSEIVRRHPEKVYYQLDSPDFERRFEAIEKKFSGLPHIETFIFRLFRIMFGPSGARKLSDFFNVITLNFRIPLFGSINYNHIDFSLLDKLHSAYISPTSINLADLEYFKREFSDTSRLDVLSIIFYLRFLADSDFSSFYKFISTPAGAFVWSKFEVAFNLATKYSPKDYDFVSYDPLSSDFRSFLYIENPISMYLESSDDADYTLYNFTLESLFVYSIRSFYTLFNIPYEGILASGQIPRTAHPANAFGAGFDDEENWNIMPDSATTGPAANINLASTVFSDFIYDYFTDPSVAVILFPFSYVDFIEDVTEIDEADSALDIDDQYILYETDVSTLDSISFYVNEDSINDDATDELDTFDPTDNQDDFGFITNSAVFNTDDTETSGDLPYYDNDLELWIDDNLEGGEDWEPEELESVEDVSISINRLFFGTLAISSLTFPATDYRIYRATFSNPKHSESGYDLNYSSNLKLAYSARSSKNLVLSQNSTDFSLFNSAGPSNSIKSTLDVWFNFFFSVLLRFYFHVIFSIFNFTFYTYANDINHIKNVLIFQHFAKYSSTYKAPVSFSNKLKDWIYGYEDFYLNKDYFDKFRDNSFSHGDMYINPRSNAFDRGFAFFGQHIPFSDFLFEEGRDSDYEMTDFLVYSQQDYIDFDNLQYKGTIDLYDNSRFTEVDELELFHMELEESAPLDGLLHEEQDWDIGATYSYSSDDFIEEFEIFNNRISIFTSALASLFSLIVDYYLYFFKVKFNKYFFNPFYYWDTRASYEWARLAATYGLSIYFVRYVCSTAIIFAIFIYSFFVFPRIFYWFFVHTLDYGFFLFANAFFTFIVFFFSWLLFFPHFSNFYANFSKDERLSLYFLISAIWVSYIFGGYGRFPWFPVLQDTEVFQNLGTEPDIAPQPLSRQYQGDSNNENLESNRSITFFDARDERELVYDGEKFPGDYYRRVWAVPLDYKAITFGMFLDSFKYNVLGIRNSYFTGYKYAHTNYDFLFTRHLIDAYHSFIHRHYIVNLGGLPRRYGRIIKRQTLNQFDRIKSLDVAYAYSTVLSGRDETQLADPTNYIIEDTFFNHTDSIADYPYDFRPDSYYNSTDDYYSKNYAPGYGSNLETARFLTNYNVNHIVPRKKIIFYKGRRYSRYNYEGNARKRKLSLYVYRYGRIGRFKYHRKHSFPKFNQTSSRFYNRLLRHKYAQENIKRGQFFFNYSSSFSKFMLFYNFPRAKGYIDMFTFRPSHLYPRSIHRSGQYAIQKYYSAVDSMSSSSVYSEFDLTSRKLDEVKDIIAEEGFYGNWAQSSRGVARINNAIKYKNFYRSNVSRLATKSKNSEAFYKPFFNFVLYSRFVYRYNNYIITLYPHIKDNYYISLSRFADRYLTNLSEPVSYRAFLSGLSSNQSKFKRSPLIQSKFSRDPKRAIRKKYRRDKKDLFSYAAKRFPNLKTSPDIFYSNFSYKLKHYARRMPFQKKNSTRRDKRLYKAKFDFYRRLPFFRQRYKKFFSNVSRYRTFRRKKYYRRRFKKRFISKVGSSIRYQNIFNNYRIYRDKWLYGLRSFNKTIASESKAMETVREHELKFKASIKRLGDKVPRTGITDRLEVKPHTIPVDFLTDFSSFKKPRFSYYKFSPVNYAFNALQFALLKSEDKLPQSLFQFSGFDRDDDFELNQDVRIMSSGLSAMDDFNRVRLFGPKRRFYKPYFYRYLEVATDRQYRPYNLFLGLKKQLTEEFILSNFLPPLEKKSTQKLPIRKFSVHHSILKIPDPIDPDKYTTHKRLKKVIPKKTSKRAQIQLKYDDWRKRRFARLVYNWQKRSSSRVKRRTLRDSRHYTRIRDRYDIGDYKAYVRRYKPRRGLFYIENKFFGPRYNEILGEAETVVARDRRRKKAALKRLREKQKKAQELAKLKKKRFESRQAERFKKISSSSHIGSAISSGSDLGDNTDFDLSAFKDPFFSHDNDDPTKFLLANKIFCLFFIYNEW